MKNKNKICILILLSVCILLVAADQLTKYIAADTLRYKDAIVFIKGLLSFTYLENKGAAWGVLSGRMNILVIVTIIIMPAIIYFIFKAEQAKKLLHNKKVLSLFQFDMMLLLAGALGNFIDRVINGYVVDFLQFTFIEFPVFNLADCYITVGAILFIVIYLFLMKEEDFTLMLKGKKKIKKENSAV